MENHTKKLELVHTFGAESVPVNSAVDSDVLATLQNVLEGIEGLQVILANDLELQGDRTGYLRMVLQLLKSNSDALSHANQVLDLGGC